MRLTELPRCPFRSISATLILCISTAHLSIWSGVALAQDTSKLARELDEIFDRIGVLTESPHCFDSSHCKSLPVGHLPCGGPGDFVTYSTLLDHETVIELLNLAHHSTLLQKEIHGIENAISTCAIRQPNPLVCHDMQCIKLSPTFGVAIVDEARSFLAADIYARQLLSLAERLTHRELSQLDRQRIVFRTALRASDCVLDELTTDPASRAAPFVDAISSPYGDEGIRQRLELVYDAKIAEEQLAIVEPLLSRCIESEEMSVLSTYPRR